MTKEDIVQKLVAIYTNPSINVTAACGIFAFEYGEYVVDVYTAAELIQAANQIDPTVKLRYQAELGAAFAMYKYFKQHPELLSFSGSTSKPFQIGDAFQKITYGAPGTGKSYGVDKITDEKNSIRVTFHPDTDYSAFMGAYKPTMVDVGRTYVNEGVEKDVVDGEGHTVSEKKIGYSFVPQAFMKAYVEAWRRWCDGNMSAAEKVFYLVIEEINRGNCAQIFGDAFQLLDRCNNGFSSYAIAPDNDVERFLREDKDYNLANLALAADVTNDKGKIVATAEQIKSGKRMALPPNFRIWATMNTSDQSLFPMDSAFKRRWDWEYKPIKNANKGWKISVKCNAEGSNPAIDAKYDWWEFLEAVNQRIGEATHSEDKKLGYFFTKPNEADSITQDRFLEKVIFYLWNDVFKDYGLAKIFKDDEGKPVAFNRFFDTATGKIDVRMIKKFLDSLKIKDESAPQPATPAASV